MYLQLIFDVIIILLYLIGISSITNIVIKKLKPKGSDFFHQILPVSFLILLSSTVINYTVYREVGGSLFFEIIIVISFLYSAYLLFSIIVLRRLWSNKYDNMVRKFEKR
jgi:hypothetical protein